MRKVKITPGEYYHIYNRSVGKQPIFLDARDWARFLFLIIHLQSPVVFYNIGRYVTTYVKYSVFNIGEEEMKKLLKTRYVELISFICMPNHFHLIVREKEGGGIARYLQRVQEAYSKYFNVKYKKSGHLFQGPYQAVHIKDNRQLLHLSAYLHRNSRRLDQWKGREHLYLWSSYQDYLRNRWGDLLRPQVILEQFKNSREYKRFIQSSRVKEFLDEAHLI